MKIRKIMEAMGINAAIKNPNVVKDFKPSETN